MIDTEDIKDIEDIEDTEDTEDIEDTEEDKTYPWLLCSADDFEHEWLAWKDAGGDMASVPKVPVWTPRSKLLPDWSAL